MSVMLKKQGGAIVLTNIGKLAVMSFIAYLGSSFVSTIWSVYMDGFVNSTVKVGFIASIFAFVSFFSYFLIIPIIEKSNKSKLYKWALFIIAIFYLLFAINSKSLIFFIVIGVFETLFIAVKITSFGIIVKDKSAKTELARNEGLLYTFFNTAWLVGPLIAGFIAEKWGVSTIFILSAIFMFVAVFLFHISKINDPHIKKRADTKPLKNFLEFFKNRDRITAYFLSFGLNFWFIFVYFFMPLFIVSKTLGNLTDSWIGYFLFAVALPSILLEYRFSKTAGKTGFRKMFRRGFLILFFAALACFGIAFLPTIFGLSNVYFILGILALAGIGVAMLEPTLEAYFLDLENKNDEVHFYGPYNTAIDVSHFVGEILSATLLIFLPFKYIFLLVAIFMLVFFFVSFRIKNVVEKRHKKHKKKEEIKL